MLGVFVGFLVTRLEHLPLLEGGRNVPLRILFKTISGIRKPYSLVIMLPSADLTSDSEHWLEWCFA